ncbi:MAG: fumarylacetoacetate hydrolase family protein [Chloroflexi bacterium]|nr:fumarylacetoacetate hydrolase family protein [Chloroflexota bacterium]
MRLVTFSAGDQPRVGAVVGDRVVDLHAASRGDVPADMLELIRAGSAAWEQARRVAAGAAGQGLPLAQVRLHAPILRPPRNVFALGWNYLDHLQESMRARGETRDLPQRPVFFSKVADCVIGPGEPIAIDPRVSQQIDWEVELAVVVGRPGKNIARANAMEHVFGYSVANDVSARDVQQRWHGGQWLKGKSLDTFCPLGPWIVTPDEVPNVQALRITSRINGQTMQDSNTRFMIFDLPTIIAELSLGLTLQAGDVILTGTPEGVGYARTPPIFLTAGDVAEMEVESIGVLRNPVVERE